MNDLPLPLPDRRITEKDKKKTNSTSEVENINKNNYNSISSDRHEEYEDFSNTLARNKETYSTKEALF